MKKVILFIFLALGIISFSAEYSNGKAVKLRLVRISSTEYKFWLTYDPVKDGIGEDEPFKARETRDEIGVAVKNGDSYYYEGESYGEICQIKITEKSKKVKVETNKACSGQDHYDGNYKYSGETSKRDAELMSD